MNANLNHEHVQHPWLEAAVLVLAVLISIGVTAAIVIFILPIVGIVLTSTLVVVALTLLALLISVPVWYVINTRARPVVEGSGYIFNQDVEVSDVRGVKLSGSGEVTIIQGDREGLTVQADENLMQYIKAHMKEGMLDLGFVRRAALKRIMPSQPIKFNLLVKDLSSLTMAGHGEIRASHLGVNDLKIKVSGPGNVTVDKLVAKTVTAHLTGQGDVRLSGAVNDQDIVISGTGRYLAGKLRSEDTIVSISGAGSATVWPTNILNVSLSGAGGLKYYGMPIVTQSVMGAGRLTSMGEYR